MPRCMDTSPWVFPPSPQQCQEQWCRVVPPWQPGSQEMDSGPHPHGSGMGLGGGGPGGFGLCCVCRALSFLSHRTHPSESRAKAAGTEPEEYGDIGREGAIGQLGRRCSARSLAGPAAQAAPKAGGTWGGLARAHGRGCHQGSLGLGTGQVSGGPGRRSLQAHQLPCGLSIPPGPREGLGSWGNAQDATQGHLPSTAGFLGQGVGTTSSAASRSSGPHPSCGVMSWIYRKGNTIQSA